MHVVFFRNNLIIHFGLLFLESKIDSYGHDLRKKYNLVTLSWIIQNSLYIISLLIERFPPPPHDGRTVLALP